MIFVGRQHSVYFEFCACEDEAVTLARHSLWPATPVSPRLCFTMEYMDLLRVLTFECKASMTSIHKAFAKHDLSLHNNADVSY